MGEPRGSKKVKSVKGDPRGQPKGGAKRGSQEVNSDSQQSRPPKCEHEKERRNEKTPTPLTLCDIKMT